MKYGLTTLILCALCFFLSDLARAETSDYFRGVESFQKKEYAEAEKHFLAAAAADSSSVETQTNLGLVYFEMGNFAKSAAWFRRALSHDPLFGPAQQGLGYLEGKGLVPAPPIQGGGFLAALNLIKDYSSRIPTVLLLLLAPLGLLGFGWVALSQAKQKKLLGPEGEIAPIPRWAWALLIVGTLSLVAQALQIWEVKTTKGTLLVAEAKASSAPQENAPVLFAISGGTELVLKNSQGEWIQVRTHQGDVGWIKSSDVLVTSIKDFN